MVWRVTFYCKAGRKNDNLLVTRNSSKAFGVLHIKTSYQRLVNHIFVYKSAIARIKEFCTKARLIAIKTY